MIRLIQRRLIVPRGDTGTFSIPVLAGKDTGDASVFTIFNPLTHRKIFEKVMQLSDGVLTMDLSHGDTVNLPVGQFVWDIKFYTNPTIADGHIVDGEEVDSYYAAFTLPVCEIRETGDNLLLSDEAPQATLSPGQIDYITASINEVTDSKNAAASSAAEADVSATNAETSASAAAVSEQAAQDSQEAALVSQQAAQTAAEQAIASAEAAAETAAHIEADLESKANIADLDDVAFSGDYNDLSNKPNIPTRISDLTDDSGHYIKPVTGIPASDLEETYLTSFIETDPTVPGWAKQAQKPTYTAQEVGAPTIQEMNTALASKLDNKFLVIFTPDPESQDTVMSYICDKTMEEIIAADEAGKLVEGRLIINNNSMQMEYNLTYTKMNAQIQGMSLKSLVFYLQINGSIITISGSPLETNGKWETKIATLLQGDLENTYNAENKRLINLSTPTNDKDAANKKYVDDKIAAYTETDPTVPAWAKAQNKPTYTAQEVGAPTVQEMNTALTAKTELFTVNFTTDSEMSTITSDKTIAEIFEAHTQGKVLQGIINLIDETRPGLAIQYIGKIILMNIASTMYMCVCEVGTASGNLIVSGTRTGNQDSWSGRLVSNLSAIGVGGDYSASNSKIINLAAPTANTDAANKKYVDDTVAAFTETDPTVPSWAKAQTKPTYTANEVGAPTVAEMNTAIGTAIGNVHQFELSILQELPTQDINTHTIYLIPKTGDTNDVYDEYVYINNAWEMIGNTQIDLSNYVQKTDYATSNTAGIVKTSNSIGILSSGEIGVIPATNNDIKEGINGSNPITPSRQYRAIFYGLAKAAGDSTQSVSTNAIGTYTTEAKEAIQTMLDVPSNTDLTLKADKTDTVLETTLSRGRKDNTTVGGASLAFGINTEASGYYSVALGLDTTASSQGAFAEGKNTVAHYIAHAEGENTQALGQWAHSQGVGTIAKGAASFVGGDHTIANGHASFVTGRYNAADSYDNWPTWAANTSYEVGDRVKRNLMVQNQPTDVGYHCTVANSDATFDNAHWELDGYHMNYVEIVGNGKEYEDPETHQTIRAGSNAYALEWNGTAHYMGNIYIGANADSTGGTKVLCEADFATAQDIQNIINGGAGA